MRKSPLILPLLWAAACAGDEAPLPVREVDVESRRVVFGGFGHVFFQVAIDHDKRVVYVLDASMRERILRVPLDGGSVRVFGKEGEGPGEMTWVVGITPDEHGGIFATDSEQFVRFYADGTAAASWSADDFVPMSLCTLGGRPVAAARWRGVAWWRTDEAQPQSLGDTTRTFNEWWRHSEQMVACVGSTAFVMDGKGVIHAFPVDASARPPPLAIPKSYVEATRRVNDQYAASIRANTEVPVLDVTVHMFDRFHGDGQGNLVAGSKVGDTVAVVLDPAIGTATSYIIARRERDGEHVHEVHLGYPVVFGDSVLWVGPDTLAVMALKEPSDRPPSAR